MSATMRVLRCGGRELALGKRTYVMGIVNVTPDSFSGDGVGDAGAAVALALAQLAAGADVVDVGGESTRPGAGAVDVDEELRRVVPVVRGLAQAGVREISVDTRRARVAQACLDEGATWVNDVSALGDDPDMARVAARADAVILMHRREFDDDSKRGDRVAYRDVVEDVRAFLAMRVVAAAAAGVARERIVVDPGIGFGKSVDDNIALLKASARLRELTGAVLVGPSRKRFIGALSGVDDAAQRTAGTLGAVACAIMHGADLVRVHDVKAAVECVRVVDAVVRGR